MNANNRRLEVLASFRKAVQCDTNNWQFRLNLALGQLSIGSRDAAVAELQEVLRIEPGCEPARQALERAMDRRE